MTPSEFKAWFDGFTEGFEGKAPTQKQWDRIKKRVKDIDGVSVTERVYVDRYRSYPWLQTEPVRRYTCSVGDRGSKFDSLAAMVALGRDDATALRA